MSSHWGEAQDSKKAMKVRLMKNLPIKVTFESINRVSVVNMDHRHQRGTLDTF